MSIAPIAPIDMGKLNIFPIRVHVIRSCLARAVLTFNFLSSLLPRVTSVGRQTLWTRSGAGSAYFPHDLKEEEADTPQLVAVLA